MAKTDNLKDYLIDLADGIRAKKGTTEPINPQDFRKEIESISGGGGGGGGDWHYFDVSGLAVVQKSQALQIAMMHKVANVMGNASVIMPAGFGYGVPVDVEEIKAIGTDYSTEIGIGEQSATIGQSVITAPWYGQAPEITKEQFYKID